jgi:hypothetical protein
MKMPKELKKNKNDPEKAVNKVIKHLKNGELTAAVNRAVTIN